ncbi:MAG: T9SS type A sorting domain-containing protein [Bacteroidales bacterium]|nr:T9SS type A sorting domain-containing protein [Bacteroidales bacterium]
MKRIFTTQLIGAVLAVSLSVQAQDSLFISEVLDPGDDYSGRFIELYNAGSETVDFQTTPCYLSRQSNGGTSWGDLQLTGSVASGNTFVIGGSGFEALYGFAPDQESGILIGNGDDAYALFTQGNHETGVLLDILGVIDVDGTGEAWEYTDSRAVRMDEVLKPNAIWTAGEWEITLANVADGDPGTHLGPVPPDTVLTGDFSISLVGDTVTRGHAVELAVAVNELAPEDHIIAYQFDIGFDTMALEFAGFTLAGTLADGGTAVVNQGTAGRLSVGYMNTTALSGAGPVMLIQFMSLLPDTTELYISNAFLNTTPVTDLTHAAVIIVETAPPTAVITYSDSVNRYADTLLITATFSEHMAAEPPVRMSLSGAVTMEEAEMTRISERVYTYLYEIPKASGEVFVSLSNGTDLWGNELVSMPTGGGTFTIIGLTPGDVNDDGLIQAYDAALTLQYSVGMDPLPGLDPRPWEPWRDSTANVDAAGGITANDAGLILQHSAGILSDFPSESVVQTPEAHVSIELENEQLVFYSHGKLLGLNINSSNEKGILGKPEVLDASFMSAVNMEDHNFRIGLCTAVPPLEGEALLKIPVLKSGSVTFHLIENTSESEWTLHLATGVAESPFEGIQVYPNPVVDKLEIAGLATSSLIRIRNLHGQIILSTRMEEAGELDLSALPAGLYLISFETGGEVLSRKIIKQ